MENGDARLEVTCEAAPTQVEGIVRGVYVYFRERWGHWTFSTATTPARDGLTQHVAADCDEFMSATKALALTEALADIYVP